MKHYSPVVIAMIKMQRIWIPIVFAIALVGCSSPKQVQEGAAPKSETSSTIGQNTDPVKKLHGQWKVESSGLTIGFTNTGIFYTMGKKDGQSIAVEMGPYRLDPTQKPMRIELELYGQKAVSLIELLDSGEMRLILSQLDPKQSLPSMMPEYADRFKKISDVATVPDGMISKIASRAKGIQSESKTVVGSMSRSTQSYFLEKGQLPTAFSQLEIGIDSESKYYQYSVKPINNLGVQLSGLSKLPEVKGYTGGVFIIPSGTDRNTVMVVCEAAKPGIGDLPAPKLVNNEPTCSEGTVSLSEKTKSETPAQSNSQTVQASPTSSESSGFNAEIFSPPSNCRSAPNETASVQKVLDKGDVLVDKNNPQKNEKGENWYQEKYLSCWIHQSQLKFK